MARPRLTTEEKAKRGTLRAHRERAYVGLASDGAEPVPDETKPVPPLIEPRDYPGIAAQYVSDVLSGRATACKWVRLACQRQDRDLRRGATDPTWPYAWDDDQATRAAHFVEQCPHVEGRWASALIKLEPCQVFLVTTLFGWRVRGDRSLRRFSTLYLEVGRKSAKSTLVAAIAYLHLLTEDEPGASVICGAKTGAQARMVFGIMQKMGRRSAWLRKQGVEVYSNAILTPDGSAKPINAKASSQDGLNPSCIILDEAHAQDFALHDVLKSAQGARSNPLLLCPTTAGYDLLSVGYALRGQVTKVLERIFEADHLLGVVYCLDDDDDWRDPKVWVKANPMLGITPKLDYVQRYCADAQQAPELEGEFKVKVCSLWATSARAWLQMSLWDRCADPALRLEQFAGQKVWIGGDLAQLDDMAAVAFVFQKEDLVVAFVRCYLPEGVVDARARAVPAYRQWVDQGLLVTTEGSMIDYDRIEADVKADCLRFKAQEIVFDQFGSAQIASRLAAAGLPAVVEPKNARTTTPPARELEARVRHGRFRHDGNGLLRWAASNVVVQRRTDDSILPKKETAESPNKIDPIDALISALGSMIRKAAKPEKSYTMLVLGGAR